MDTDVPVATAAVSWADSGGSHIRVYSCDGSTVIERYSDAGGPWGTSAFSAPGSHVSAACWQDSAGNHVRVYCTFEGQTVEYCADPGNGVWVKGSYTTG